MGLDITAYKKLTPIDAVFNQDGEPIDPKTREPLECDYFQMEENPHYTERADGLARGIYAYEDATRFRAGSYLGYSQWRDQLAELAGYPETPSDDFHKHSSSAWNAESGPFWELINFSDCEGTIGPITSAKLAKDFGDHQSKADAHELDWFRSLYGKWREAFEMASDNGCVSFH